MADPVLLVTQHYRPEVIGSASYCTDLAEWLAGQGRPVTVLTGRPHYPNPDDFADFNARAPKREVTGGIVVERLRSWAPRRRSAALRILSECLFLLAGLFALLSGRVKRHGLVVSLCPSIFAVMLGILATRRGGRHVAMVHDIQSGLAAGLNLVRSGLLLRAMRWCERVTLNRLDAVCVLTAEMKVQLRRLGVTVPIEILPIWVDTDRITPQPRDRAGSPVLLYSGNLGRKQGLEQILALAATLAKIRPEVKIVLRGDGSEKTALMQEVARLGLQNVEFAGLLPRERLNEGLALGDLHLVPQKPSAADFAIPSKIYSIMAAGRPFIATAHPGSSLWRLQETTGAFLCVPPEDPAAFCEAALALLDDPALREEMGRKGRSFIEQSHGRAAVLAAFTASLDGAGMAARRQVVFLEPDRDGHPREWVQHLMRYTMQQQDIARIWFVIAPEIRSSLLAEIPEDLRDRVRMIALTEDERRMCTHRRLAISGFSRWWVMRRYLKRTGARAGYFLSLDHLSLPLALGLGAAGRKLGGILFRPSVHYGRLGPNHPTWAERLRDLRKTLLYRLMLLNPALHVVLTLDPFFPDYAVQHYRGGHKVHALPDPAHPPVRPAGPGAVPVAIPEDRIVLLLFGVLTARKGILHLMEALQLLGPGVASRTAVVVAGKVAPEISAPLKAQVERLQRHRPDLWFHIEDRWLDSGEIGALVERCDVVLAPYQRFVGSSGVLLWAAGAAKPLLTQDYGLLGRLVQDHSLGLAADVTRPEQLARAIEEMVVEGPQRYIDQKAARSFVSDRTPEAFAAQIFGSLRAL